MVNKFAIFDRTTGDWLESYDSENQDSWIDYNKPEQLELFATQEDAQRMVGILVELFRFRDVTVETDDFAIFPVRKRSYYEIAK